MANTTLNKLLQLCEKRGFFYRAAEIYGGIEGIYDSGILGTAIKLNLINLWRKWVVQRDPEVAEIDGSKLLPEDVWVGSGHTKLFNDMYRECKKCHKRFDPTLRTCSSCGGDDLTHERMFESMFSVKLDTDKFTFLPAEISQSTFLNFNNFVKKNRMSIPFGIAQIGRAYRNEITPRHFIFKTREFDQMEVEYFVDDADSERRYTDVIEKRLNWYTKVLEIDEKLLRIREHDSSDLAHYSRATTDIEFKFNFSDSVYGEIEGISNRGIYDLKSHSKSSGCELYMFDTAANKRIYPAVVEASAGLNRILFAVLLSAYSEEEVDGKSRVVLKLNSSLAPYQYSVFPLVKDLRLIENARFIFNKLIEKNYRTGYDVAGSIGRRYRRQDEIGTPKCITVDFKTLEDNTVTVRDRDTLEQVRVPYKSLLV